MRFSCVTAIAAVALLLTGCSVSTPGTPAVQRAGDSIALVEPAPPAAVMEALLTGTLARDEAGCLALDTGSDLYVVQFPHGTALLNDGTGVDVPGLGRVLLGDAFEGGGGYTSLVRTAAECEAETYALWQTVIE